MRPTEPIASPASTPKVGRFGALSGLPHIQGSGARSRTLILTPLMALVAVVGLLAFAAVPTMADNGHGLTNSFGSETSTVKDPEPLSTPTGVAWSEKTNEIYVIDAGHNRIERFSSTGVYEGQFTGSETPATELSSPRAIAVDNEPSSPSYGDVYVADAGHDVIDKFEPEGKYLNQLTGSAEGVVFAGLSGVSVDPLGDLWVYEEAGFVDEFDDTVTNASLLLRSHTGLFEPSGLAVGAKDALYVVESYYKLLQKYSGAGEEDFLGLISGCNCVTAVALDPATENVYTDQGTSVAEYKPGGEPFGALPLGQFGSGALEGSDGIAVSAVGTVYAADTTANDVDVFALGAKPVQPADEQAGPVEGVSATLEGKLEGGESSYHFAYNTNGTCSGSGTVVTPGGVRTGTATVSATVTGLVAKTKYTFCLFDENKYGQETGVPVTFETKSSVPQVEKTSSSVTLAQATLSASVNPELEASTCVFQYGNSEAYGHEAKCTPEALGDEGVGVPVNATIEGLEPNTTYDYRVLASNGTGRQPGPNEMFTTEVITPTEVETAAAADVTATSAVIGGQVNPQGGATYYIEYGSPTCSLNGIPNFAWWLCATESNEAGPLSGDSVRTVTPIEVTGLTPGATYSYWIVAHNANGSERGEEGTFTTPIATPPVVTPPSSLAQAPIVMPLSAPVKPLITKKTAGQEKTEKLTKALKQCKKLRSNAKRKTCEAQAQKRYGSKTKSKPKPHKRGK